MPDKQAATILSILGSTLVCVLLAVIVMDWSSPNHTETLVVFGLSVLTLVVALFVGQSNDQKQEETRKAVEANTTAINTLNESVLILTLTMR
jgi:uncharacterized membrane protein